jgi:GNAT superfamily N-acetyltransferase
VIPFRQGGLHDLDEVIRLRDQAKTWLAARGSDQWQYDFPDRETMIAGFARALENGETWLYQDSDYRILGMVTLNSRTDHGLWTEKEEREALFIHRLTRDFARPQSRGVGDRLLDFAAGFAAGRGYTWLRLDAWTSPRAAGLWASYVARGFEFVRTVEGHHTPSAVCFQRSTGLISTSPSPDTPGGGE